MKLAPELHEWVKWELRSAHRLARMHFPPDVTPVIVISCVDLDFARAAAAFVQIELTGVIWRFVVGVEGIRVKA